MVREGEHDLVVVSDSREIIQWCRPKLQGWAVCLGVVIGV